MKQISKRMLSLLTAFALLIACTPVIPLQVNAETSGYYTYTVSNGEATITACDDSISGDIVIPDTLGGYPVTSIGASAFKNCTGLAGVVVPDSVTSIGMGAFTGCSGLESITIPFVGGSKNSALGSYQYPFGYIFGGSEEVITQFYRAYGKKDIVFRDYSIPKNLKSVTVTGGHIPYGAFSNCSILTNVILGDNVTSIGNGAFYHCGGLTSVTLPNSIKSIGEFTFYGCDSLTSIVIPDSVIGIGYLAFADCSGLTSVKLSNNVTYVGVAAFHSCGRLTNVMIPDSTTSIGDYAFACCSKLNNVTIGKDVTSIGYNAFQDCTSLTDVYFTGTEAQWNEISMSQAGTVYSATIHCNSTFVPDEITHIHKYSAVVTAPITCAVDGYTTYTCECGDSYVGNFVSCHEWQISDITVYSCGSNSSAIFDCIDWDDCCESYICEIPAIGHCFEDGICIVCRASSESNRGSCGDDLIWEMDEAGTLTITGTGKMSSYSSSSIPWYNYRSVIKNVIIENGAISISPNAFSYCYDLTNITIPNSVTNIGASAFSSCYDLTDVYYEGTQEQWNAMIINSGNTYLTSATIHYNHIHDYSLISPVKVDATCTEAGYTQHTCIYGDTYNTDYVPALGHDLQNVGTLKEPTCTEKGSAGGQCTRCKELITSDVAALGHSMVVLQAKDATCTEDGSTVGSKCERCDYYGITPTVIPATGHSFADGACGVCGLEGIAVHKQGDAETYYNTLEEALAVTGGTIQLLADVTADAVNLNVGVTLDLNGHTLTVNAISGNVMDSQDGEGLIKVGVKNANLTTPDDQLILWDKANGNAGYRIFNYTFQNLGVDAHKDDAIESAKIGMTVKSVWSDLVFTNSYAYTLAASAYSGLQVGFQLSWTPNGGATTSKTFNFAAETVSAWGTAEEGNAGDANYCFYIRVTGFEELLESGMVTVKSVIRTAFHSAETDVTQIQYTYAEPAPGGLTYETGFGIVPEA